MASPPPASPRGTGQSAALPDQPPLPGLAALPMPIFIPGKIVLPPCRPTRHVTSSCMRSSLISAWGSRCGLGSWTCQYAPYLDSPRTEGIVSWDSPLWVGSGNRDLGWASNSHLPTPASLSSFPCQPHPSFSVLIPLPRPPQHPCPRPPATPRQHPTLPHPVTAMAWLHGNLPVPSPCPEHPCPAAGQQQTCYQTLSTARGGSFGAEVSLFLAACNGI